MATFKSIYKDLLKKNIEIDRLIDWQPDFIDFANKVTKDNKVNIDGKGISLSSGGLASVIINSNGIQLTGNITGIDYNNLSNRPSIPDAESLKMTPEEIAEAIANKSDGLFFYDNNSFLVKEGFYGKIILSHCLWFSSL